MTDQEIDQKEAFAAEMRGVSGQAEPAVAAEPVAEPAVKSEPVAKSEESDTFDINSLPPAAQKLLEAERKRLAELDDKLREADRDRRSLRGRIPWLEKKLERFESEQHRRAAATPRAQPTAAATPVKKEPSTLQALPGYQKLRQVFADDAAPIEEAFIALESHNQKLAERFAKMEELLEKDVRPRISVVDELRELRANEQYERENEGVFKARETLATKFKDYQSHIKHELDENNEIVGTVMSPEFEGWIEQKPARIRELFGQDATAEDVEYGLELFYRDVVNAQSQASQQQAADTLKARQEQLTRRAVSTANGSGLHAEGKLSDAERYKRDMQSNFG